MDENGNVTSKRELTTHWDITTDEISDITPKRLIKEEVAQFLLAAIKQNIELSDVCKLLENEYQKDR